MRHEQNSAVRVSRGVWCVKNRRGLTQEAIDEAGSLGRQVGVGRILEHSAFHRRQALLIRLPCRHRHMRLAADTGAPHASLGRALDSRALRLPCVLWHSTPPHPCPGRRCGTAKKGRRQEHPPELAYQMRKQHIQAHQQAPRTPEGRWGKAGQNERSRL